MYSIGEFSKLSRVTVKALRYYDDIGLFKPASVDRFTGYRWYEANQLPRLHRILALPDLGLSLDDIGRVLQNALSVDELRGMLRLKQAELSQRVRDDQARLDQVAARIQWMEQENRMPDHEIVIKTVDPTLVASIRRIIPEYGAIGPLYGELFGYLAPLGAAGLTGAVWHDEEYKERDVDAEAFVVLPRPVPSQGDIRVHELPAATMASVMFNGPYAQFPEVYASFMEWIPRNGYQIIGSNRELYLQMPANGDQHDPSAVTEILFPVAKG